MEPVGALIGAILLGAGTIILYGAVKNKKVFGKDGLLPTAVTTGTITDLTKIPPAFGELVPGNVDTNIGKSVGNAQGVKIAVVQVAIANIVSTDPNLGNAIEASVSGINSDTSKLQLAPLRALLVFADAGGHKADADIIRNYVRETTGESF